jgi:UDP-N-acetylmuramoylalanine--D-glutamate ligase
VEWVGGVEYYNDSKATNPDAVSKALGAFDERPVVIMLGGQRKDVDLRPLAVQVADTARAAVLFGEARDQLAEAFAGLAVTTLSAVTMSDGVRMAAGIAREGDVVLLSPGCKSFDEFTSYEERGRVFKSAVASLARKAAEETQR